MDVKPDNLFRNHCGTFQVGDFGLAITSSKDEVGAVPRCWFLSFGLPLMCRKVLF